MNGSFIALTLSSEEVKLAQIRQQNGTSLVQRIWHLQAEQDATVQMEARLKRLIEEKIPGTRRTLLVIGGGDVVYRDFAFPFTSSKKVAEAIRFETADEFPPAQYLVDPIESISGEPGRKSFLVAIARRDVLQQRIRSAEESGLSIIGITTDVSSLGNYFIDDNEALVMDAGLTQTLFVLYSHRVPILVREIPIGVKHLSKSSGEYKREDVRPLAGEIKRTLLSFSARSRFDLNRVYLSGSLVGQKDLIHALDEGVGFHFIDQPPSTRESEIVDQKADLNKYASILGTARWKKGIKLFDFYKEEFAGPDALASGRTYFKWAASVVVCFLFAFLVSSWLEIFAMQKRDNFLGSEIRRVFSTTFPQVTRVVDEVKQARSLFETRRSELVGASPVSTTSVLEILDLMSRIIPKEVYFQAVNLYWERGRLEIDGRTDSFKTVNVIQELLSKSRDFPEVNISNAKTRSDSQDVDFKITIRIAG
jgi:Tfp pilus assembly protein PilN/Tfp pilus assembly PilM family ATPase